MSGGDRAERERQARLDALMQRAMAMTRAVDSWRDEVRNTLHVEPEDRTIYLFEGTQRNNDVHREWFGVPNFLPMYCAYERGDFRVNGWPYEPRARFRHTPIAMSRQPTGEFRYLATAQGVAYTIQVLNDKSQLRTKLGLAGAFVLYNGHARYGRGPCSGRGGQTYRGQDWQDGDDPTLGGIYRMGFDYIGVPATEILEHGYTAHLYSGAAEPEPTRCDPGLRRILGTRNRGDLRRMTLAEIQQRVVRYHPHLEGDLAGQVTGANGSTEVWTYLADSHGDTLRHVIHDAGSSDLASTTVNCRAFFHTGCSTGPLNRSIWVETHNHPQVGDNGISYWSSATSNVFGVAYLIYRLMTYNQLSAGRPWADWIRAAVDATNDDLRYDRAGFTYVSGAAASTGSGSCSTGCVAPVPT
ncbi:MAG: hypothetical protein U0271_00295 [Polyangiaceae bacterium]